MDLINIDHALRDLRGRLETERAGAIDFYEDECISFRHRHDNDV